MSAQQPLRKIIYSSTANSVVWDDVVAIREGASALNSVCGVTGLLVYGDGHFLQLLEGPPAHVSRIYHSRIVPDRRHSDINLIYANETRVRSFAEWGMALAHIDGTWRPRLRDITGSEAFTPTDWSRDQAESFLALRDEMRDALSI